MKKQNSIEKPPEIQPPETAPEIARPDDPQEPVVPAEDPDWMPFENPFEAPYEVPPPGEGM